MKVSSQLAEVTSAGIVNSWCAEQRTQSLVCWLLKVWLLVLQCSSTR